MRETKGNRLNITIYGRRNVGKSTIFNLILGTDFSIVSNIKGTTTDSIRKAMELEPFGAISLVDSAGFDDINTLGKLRVEKTKKTLMQAEVALFICDSEGLKEDDFKFLELIKNFKIPSILIINKQDEEKISKEKLEEAKKHFNSYILTSAKNVTRDDFLKLLKNSLRLVLEDAKNTPVSAIPENIQKGDLVILVIPLDKAAPKGRLILPQVQILRELLDKGCVAVCVGIDELEYAIKNSITRPKLVIVDSQVFGAVEKIIPQDMLLTSFSCLFANLKGDIDEFVTSANKLDNLQDNDKILILESCTHHATDDDIGRVKIPNLIKKYTGKNVIFEHFSGCDFPDVSTYSLVVHCGACMTNRKEILNRIKICKELNVPITNYGIVISKCLGILERAIEVFKIDTQPEK
ncbi:[bacterium]|nr:[FeFe] hydrogenase H-cluster maturation GTPase HydF [bacterium]